MLKIAVASHLLSKKPPEVAYVLFRAHDLKQKQNTPNSREM